MAQKEATIENLPDRILERIFSYISYDSKRLREVCKKFNEVFINSTILMEKLTLNVSKAVKNGARAIDRNYQAITFGELGQDEFELINNFKQKNSIKSVNITEDEREIMCFNAYIQNMLYGFTSLKHISFYIDSFGYFFRNNFKFSTLEQSKLDTLSVSFDAEKTNLLEMFSKIPGIKKLHVSPFRATLKFPDVDWKLEELIMDGVNLDYTRFKKFMESQKATLKVLKLDDPAVINYITMNLTNLEKLAISINGKETVDKLPFKGEKLRSLTISESDLAESNDSDSDDEIFNSSISRNRVGEDILSHYNNIKCLNVYSGDLIYLNLANNLELNNLTHLIMQNCSTNLLFKAKMPNLKYLSASYDVFFDNANESEQEPEEIKAENFMNVEALTIYEWAIENIPDILEKFPNLKHLNLGSSDFLSECYSIAEVVNDVAPIGSKLSILGIWEECLSDRRDTYKQLLSEINNKRIVIKLYDHCGQMNVDYWDPADYRFYYEA